MYKLEDLKELFLYRNKRISFDKTVSVKKGTMIFFLSRNSKEDLSKMFNSNLFYNQYLKSLYTPKFYKSPILRNKRYIVNQKEYYTEMAEKNVNLTTFKINLPLYKGINLVYDMSNEINSYLDDNKFTSTRRVNFFNTYLNDILNTVTDDMGYTDKILLIPMYDTSKDFRKELTSVMNIDSIISYLYFIFKLNINTSDDFKNLTLVFHNADKKAFFKMKVQDIDNKKINELKKMLLMLSRMNKENIDINDEEEENIKGDTNNDGNIDSDDINTVIPIPDKIINPKTEKATKRVTNAVLKTFQVDPVINKLTTSEVEIAQKITDKVESIANKRHVSNFVRDIEDTDETIEEFEENSEEINEEEILEELQKDEEFIEYLEEIKDKKIKIKKNELNDKYTESLRQKQKEVELEGKSLQDIVTEFKEKSIDVKEIPLKNNIFKEVQYSKLKDFDASYNKNQKDKDMINIITSFSNDKDLPVFVKNIERKDVSDDFNKKELLTVEMEDINHGKHTFKVEIPKLIDDKFMYINGGKKMIVKQITRLPIVKLEPDVVEITTNYNKMRITRFGRNINPTINKFKKFLSDNNVNIPKDKVNLNRGDNSLANKEFMNTLEYNEVSSILTKASIDNKYFFNFGRKNILQELEEKELENLHEKNNRYFPIGYIDKSIIVVNLDDSKVIKLTQVKNEIIEEFMGNNIMDVLLNLMSDSLKEDMYKTISSYSSGTKFTYTRVTIISRHIPLGIVLSYYMGITKMLNTYGIKYELTETKKNLTPKESSEYNVIKFKDHYLYYPANPYRYSLLLNGFSELDTEYYNFEDYNNKESYLDYFHTMFGSRNISKGVENTLDLMIDPITKEILIDLELPVNIDELMLYANSLLENTSHSQPNDMSNYRIRGNEQINAYLYYLMSNAYRQYKDATRSGKKNMKISIPQDQLIKTMLESPMVDEYSILNPIQEAEKMGASTYKGLSGVNLESAYKLNMRAYNSSMLGGLTLSTPDSSAVGVVRQLTFNPKLISNRGYLQPDANVSQMNATDILGPSELLSPFTAQHSDPPRIGMQTTQSKHILPTITQTKPLFGSGIEKSLAYVIGSDFVFKSKSDGIVEKIDNKNELMVLRYSDGTKDVVDISSRPAKNGNGGFYITNKKTPVLAEGQKFKKDTIVAKNEDFFKGNGVTDDITFVSGRLSKVAVMGGSYTYEDSCLINETLSEEMSSYITMIKEASLGPNANVEFLATKGSKIKSGEELMVFENSFDESEANELLDRIGQEFNEAISDLGKNKIVSKYTGEIVDIKILYNHPLEELSPSLQSIIKKYNGDVNSKKNAIKNYAEGSEVNILSVPSSEKVEAIKSGGKDVDGVLFQFFVRYKDNMHVGDKLSFSVALKSIVAEVVSKEESPYSEFKPEEEIEAIMSPLSVMNRMCQDVFDQGYLNKVLLGLKDKVKEIYES